MFEELSKKIKAAEVTIPREALEKLEFRVSVGEDGDGLAVAEVELDGATYTLIVDDFQAWDDHGDEPGTAAAFKQVALEGQMLFSKIPAWATSRRKGAIYAHQRG